eukprot:214435-Pelagomonas_calceolata.AAC.6
MFGLFLPTFYNHVSQTTCPCFSILGHAKDNCSMIRPPCSTQCTLLALAPKQAITVQHAASASKHVLTSIRVHIPANEHLFSAWGRSNHTCEMRVPANEHLSWCMGKTQLYLWDAYAGKRAYLVHGEAATTLMGCSDALFPTTTIGWAN